MINAAIYVANKVAGDEEGEKQGSVCSSKDLGRKESKGSQGGGGGSKDSIPYIPCILTPVMMALEENEKEKKGEEEDEKKNSDATVARSEKKAVQSGKKNAADVNSGLPIGVLSLDDDATPIGLSTSTALAPSKNFD